MIEKIASSIPVKEITIEEVPGSSEFIAVFLGFVFVQEGSTLKDDECDVLHEQIHMVQCMANWLIPTLLAFAAGLGWWSIPVGIVSGTLLYYAEWFLLGQDDSILETQADQHEQRCRGEFEDGVVAQ